MALKATCYVIMSMAVLFSTCSAVTVNVNDVAVVENTEGRMTCNIVKDTITANPIVTWNKVTNGVPDTIAVYQSGGGSVESSYIDRFTVEGDITLVINNTQRSDSGTYQCDVIVVGDSPPTADDMCELNVLYLDTPVVLSFTTPVNESDTVVLSCSANANPPPVYTFKKDGVIEQQGGASTYTLKSKRGDKGIYACEASNSARTETSDSKMLDVYYAPEITPLGLDNRDVSPGETVVISFTVVANPAATYEWTSATTTDDDNDPETYTFVVSSVSSIGETYKVTLDASNVVGAQQHSVVVTVVDSCGALTIKKGNEDTTNGEITANIDENIVLDCLCGGTSSGKGFEYKWNLDGDVDEVSSNRQLIFKAVEGGHDVVCIGTAGAPVPTTVSVKVSTTGKLVNKDGGVGTGAIIGIVLGIIVMLIILGVVIIIVLKSRDDGPSNKSADSAYMDVTWDTKDPNRVNQGKKTGAPPSNGTKQQEAAKPDPYEKYDGQYGDERAYNRTSYGEDYNDKAGEDDYANSMPVTV